MEDLVSLKDYPKAFHGAACRALQQTFEIVGAHPLTVIDFTVGCLSLQTHCKSFSKLLTSCYRLMATTGEKVLTVQKFFDAVRNSEFTVDWTFVNEVRYLVASTKREMLSEQRNCFSIKMPRELHAEML